MRVVVPHQRSDTVATAQASLLKRLGQRAGATVNVGKSVTMQRTIRQPGNNFSLREKLSGTLQKMGERQRVVHHCALHTVFSCSTISAIYKENRSFLGLQIITYVR